MESEELSKSYYRIKEVAEELGVAQSTLRFWESKIPALKPSRSRSNVRYYTPEDIERLKVVHFLVKQKGLKIEAAAEQLRVNKTNVFQRQEIVERLGAVRNELQDLLKALNKRK